MDSNFLAAAGFQSEAGGIKASATKTPALRDNDAVSVKATWGGENFNLLMASPADISWPPPPRVQDHHDLGKAGTSNSQKLGNCPQLLIDFGSDTDFDGDHKRKHKSGQDSQVGTIHTAGSDKKSGLNPLAKAFIPAPKPQQQPARKFAVAIRPQSARPDAPQVQNAPPQKATPQKAPPQQASSQQASSQQARPSPLPSLMPKGTAPPSNPVRAKKDDDEWSEMPSPPAGGEKYKFSSSVNLISSENYHVLPAPIHVTGSTPVFLRGEPVPPPPEYKPGKSGHARVNKAPKHTPPPARPVQQHAETKVGETKIGGTKVADQAPKITMPTRPALHHAEASTAKQPPKTPLVQGYPDAEAANKLPKTQSSALPVQKHSKSGSVNPTLIAPQEADYLVSQLKRFGAPRPNKDFEGSPPPSMPSVSDFEDEGDQDGAAAGGKPAYEDIRGELAPLIKDKWDLQYANDEHEKVLGSDTYLGRWVRFWAAYNAKVQALDPIKVHFLSQGIEGHEDCEVNPETGTLESPICFPCTFPDPEGGLDKEQEFRRLHWTSEFQAKYADDIKRWAREAKRKATIKRHRPPPGWAPTTPPRGNGLLLISPGADMSTSAACDSAWYLRPAIKDDMASVAQIYNWEIHHGTQALDSKELLVRKAWALLEMVENLHVPFLVAVMGPSDKPTSGVIVGFAYLSLWEPSPTGDSTGGHSGSSPHSMNLKVNLFVNAEHRKMGLGSALLDKLLSTVSPKFSTCLEYDFVNPNEMAIYNPRDGDGDGGKTARKCCQIYITYLIKHASSKQDVDAQLDWVRKLLGGRFKFVEKARLECARRPTNRDGGGDVKWLDSVIFAHACQDELDVPGTVN